jgi:hypothetical protein
MDMRQLSVLLGVGLVVAAAQAVDQTKPYGRAALALAEADGEKPLDETAQPGEGKSLVIYLDANTPCIALIVPFNRKGEKLVNGWTPLLVEVGEWDAQRLPRKPQVWEWKPSAEPFDVQVFFLAKETPGVDKLRTLIKAIAAPGREATLARLQEQQLRELVARWLADESSVVARPPSAPARIGGTLRATGGEFPWRDYGRSANFSAERPGVVSFRHDGR